MIGALALTVALMAQRGEFVPQHELPYIDALPLDYPDRVAVINKYRDRAEKELEPQGCEDFWQWRAATRLFLRDQKQYDAAYMLGRLQGRHYLWQWSQEHQCWRWIDTR